MAQVVDWADTNCTIRSSIKLMINDESIIVVVNDFIVCFLIKKTFGN